MTAAEDVVPLGEDIGRDDDLIADRPLDREPPVVDRRPDVLDNDAGGVRSPTAAPVFATSGSAMPGPLS